ncbi:MAG: glycoside hydrolase family 3 C-terminal domain-containing protein [Bryobacteraceae bacterium]
MKRFCVSLLLFGALAVAQFPGARPPAKGPWSNGKLPPEERARLLVQAMTLEEKIQMVHGIGWFFGADMNLSGQQPPPVVYRSNGGGGFIPGIPRLGVPDLQMNDAMVGSGGGARMGRYSTAMPSALALASSWDLDLAFEYAALIGRELRDQGFNITLGGGLNLTREPRNGRNFEYLGEDPLLAGRMAARYVQGKQSQGIVGILKHYALNNQESGRYFVNVRMPRKGARESELLAFEIAVKEGQPGSIMCSYNLVDGDYACENAWLLNEVLKKEWGFPGFVMSDWGATHSTVKAALNGLDMEMPGHTFFGDALKAAVEKGEVPVERLDDMVRRISWAMFRAGLFDRAPQRQVPDIFRGFEVAQKAAEAGIVLLKNAGAVLPLDPQMKGTIAVIGGHADKGVLSGGGSAQVDPAGGNAVTPPPLKPGSSILDMIFGTPVYHRSSPLKAIQALAQGARVVYHDGKDIAGAASLAKSASVAVVFAVQHTSEGRDLPNLALPDGQDELIATVAAANPRTVVVLETGTAVKMPWLGRVAAVVEAWYPGIRGGEAIANVLFGRVNPSGKLAMTFPKSEDDLAQPRLAEQPPARGPQDFGPMFPGGPAMLRVNTRQFDLEYPEGARTGYRWFQSMKREPLFPFGFGLSYTTFAYADLRVDAAKREVRFTLRNTGSREGAEVAQVYVQLPASAGENFRRLAGWQKVNLKPGESREVSVALHPLALAVFDEKANRWETPRGDYRVFVGGSSADTPLSAGMTVP